MTQEQVKATYMVPMHIVVAKEVNGQVELVRSYRN